MPTVEGTVELASSLRMPVMRLARRLRSERSDHGLTLTQLTTLSTLERCGPLTPGELADHERVQPPSMTRTIASLEAAGMVTRTPHATDRRQHLVTATPAAAALLHEDRRRRDAWLSLRLADLTVAERELLRAVSPLLDRLAAS